MANDSDTLEKTDKARIEPISEEPKLPGHERKLDRRCQYRKQCCGIRQKDGYS